MKIENSLDLIRLRIRTKDFLDSAKMKIRIESFLDLQFMSKTNQDWGTTGKSPNRIIRLAHKFAKFVIQTGMKVREPLTYDKT